MATDKFRAKMHGLTHDEMVEMTYTAIEEAKELRKEVEQLTKKLEAKENAHADAPANTHALAIADAPAQLADAPQTGAQTYYHSIGQSDRDVHLRSLNQLSALIQQMSPSAAQLETVAYLVQSLTGGIQAYAEREQSYVRELEFLTSRPLICSVNAD